MKEKASITIERSVLDELERRLPEQASRSAAIETALRDWLTRLEREERDERDIEVINRYAAELNSEMEDVLQYQADAFEE
jgi:metal-responsive CopG/Arc/MetJ family transcriptional regulator